MKSIFIAIFFLISGIAFADVPNTFEAGSAIKASEMNENFTSIDSKVDALDSRTENVSELETKVANLEGQVETLQSLVNSVADTASTDVEFVGFTDPAIFGSLGIKVGRSMCPNLYPGSHICTTGDLQTLVNWSGFIAPSPVIIGHDQTISDSGGPCSNFTSASSDSNNTIAMMIEASDNVIIHRGSSSGAYAYSKWPISQSWLINNSSSTGSSVNDHNYPNSLYYQYSTSQPRFSVCNTTVPAACCK